MDRYEFLPEAVELIIEMENIGILRKNNLIELYYLANGEKVKQRGAALLLVLSGILLMSTMVSTTYLYLSNMLYFVGDSRTKQDDKQLLLGSEGVFNNIAKEILNREGFGGAYSKLLTSPSAISINNRDVYYSLIDRTSCFNINTLYDSFSNMNKYNKYYPWLVLDNILQLNNIVSSVSNKLMTIFIQYPSNLDHIDSF